MSKIETKFDRPIIFRTFDKLVYESTLKNGEIWMRSSEYYQKIEDLSRQDKSEGVNRTQVRLPLNFAPESAQGIRLMGDGSVG